jgi:hypothetical protein
MALPRKTALAEAKMRTRNGYPHQAVEVLRHREGCLVSDGTILPPYPCTCDDAKRVGWSLQLVR